jgi:hypothetical protein
MRVGRPENDSKTFLSDNLMPRGPDAFSENVRYSNNRQTIRKAEELYSRTAAINKLACVNSLGRTSSIASYAVAKSDLTRVGNMTLQECQSISKKLEY